MESDLKIQKLTQNVLKFLCFKHQIIIEKPFPELRFMPEIAPQFADNICNAVWVQSFIHDFLYSGFFQKHFQRMTVSSELFTKYVSFACYTFIEGVTEEYANVFDTLCLVMYFGLRCWEVGSKQCLNVCVDLFCTFYEMELRGKFESRGGFENFNECIEELIEERHLSHLFNANITSFEQFNQLKGIDLKRQSFKEYIHALQRFSQTEIETDKKAVSFTKSVADKIGGLYQKPFDEILADFAKTDKLEEDIYRRLEKTSDGLARDSDQISFQKVKEEKSQNRTRKNKSEIKELVKQMVMSHNLDTMCSDIPTKTSTCVSLKSEKLKTLLDGISKDYSRLYELIQSLCTRHRVRFPVLIEAESSV